MTDQAYLDAIPGKVAAARAAFTTGKTKPKEWRLEQLKALRRLITEHALEINAALMADMARDPHSSFLAETSPIEQEIVNAIDNLHKWMKPESLPIGLANKPGHATLRPEPFGVVLIMAAWNFPFLTLLQPAVGALAAGNAVVLKPASLAGNSSLLIATLVKKFMDPEAVVVIEGAANCASVALAQRFDKIMYTGGSVVGRIVMEAASKFLTPVDLELGGKNPCIVTPNVKALVDVAARRIAWAKFAVNTGQVCIAPDYLMVHESVGDKFVECLAGCITEFFGTDPKQSEFFGRIINVRHASRLNEILQADKAFVTLGGTADVDAKYISPTIINFEGDFGAFIASKAMQDEVFGPIVPVVYYKDIAECVNLVNSREKALSAYVFGSSADVELFISSTSAGSVTVNDCIMQKTELAIPFGGVGMSGTGRYNGKYSFEAFSFYKPVLIKGLKGDLDARYPPYTSSRRQLLVDLHRVMIGEKGIMSFGMNMLKYNLGR